MKLIKKFKDKLISSKCIYDINNKDYVKSNTYSETETIVGTYNGKPLYRKTIKCGNLPNNASKTISHNISNIDIIFNFYGIAYSSTNELTWFYSLPMPANSNITILINRTNIQISTQSDRTTTDISLITLEYTKTTD